MAKRARTRRVYVRARRTHRRGRSGSSAMSLIKGAALYGFAKPYIDRFAGGFVPGLDPKIRDGVAGYFLMSKGGLVGDIAKGAVVVNAAAIANQMSTSGSLGSIFGGINTAAGSTAATTSSDDWSKG